MSKNFILIVIGYGLRVNDFTHRPRILTNSLMFKFVSYITSVM